MIRFFDPSSFDLIRVFMGLDAEFDDTGYIDDDTYKEFRDKKEKAKQSLLNSLTPNAQGEIILSKDFLINKLYEMGDFRLGIDMHHALYDGNFIGSDGKEYNDHAERTYIWGSQQFMISPNTQFVILADGSREIRNFSIIHRNAIVDSNGNIDSQSIKEDFDFSGGFLSEVARPALEPVIDPSGIGNTVVFEFYGKELIFTINEDGKAPTSTITQEAFQKLYDNNQYPVYPSINIYNLIDLMRESQDMYTVLDALAGKGEQFIKDLFNNGKGPIGFLDAEGRPIIYCGDNGSKIKGSVTSHMVDGKFVDISKDFFNINIKYGIDLWKGLDNILAEYVKNGITYVGGAGQDHITAAKATINSMEKAAMIVWQAIKAKIGCLAVKVMTIFTAGMTTTISTATAMTRNQARMKRSKAKAAATIFTAAKAMTTCGAAWATTIFSCRRRRNQRFYPLPLFVCKSFIFTHVYNLT